MGRLSAAVCRTPKYIDLYQTPCTAVEYRIGQLSPREHRFRQIHNRATRIGKGVRMITRWVRVPLSPRVYEAGTDSCNVVLVLLVLIAVEAVL